MSQEVKREEGGGVAWPWNVRNQRLDQIAQGGAQREEKVSQLTLKECAEALKTVKIVD
jgi:hypothetical protein